MLDKNLIVDMVHDEAMQDLQGFKFLYKILEELEIETDKSAQVAYVEKLNEAGMVLDEVMEENGKDIGDEWVFFQEKIYDFVQKNELTEVASDEGHTPMQFLGFGFLHRLLEKLKDEPDSSKQVVCLEKLDQAAYDTVDTLGDTIDNDDCIYFQEALTRFIEENELRAVATHEGRTPLHFMGGMDVVVLVSEIPPEEMSRLYEMKDNQGRDIFAGRDGYECHVMLALFEPEMRADFLVRNKHILEPLDGQDVAEIVGDFSPEQIIKVFSSKKEGEPSLWEGFETRKRDLILRDLRSKIRGVCEPILQVVPPVIKITGPDLPKGNSGSEGHPRV